MKSQDFEIFSTLLHRRSGLSLTPDKAYLLEARLEPVARAWKLSGLEALATAVRAGRDERLLRDITDAMTTNESSFFRDLKPFEQFQNQVLPSLMSSRSPKKTLRIWSAACSSGQEAYSLAMIIHELGSVGAGWRFEIVGTDISSDMIERARSGLYTQFEVQRGLPVQRLVRHFRQAGDKWQISEALRAAARFREYNLLDDLSPLGTFDIVFCRNVLIYFDTPTKARVLNSISRLMPADGVLFLGGAETVLGITDSFQPVGGHRGLYAPSRSVDARDRA